MLSLLAKLLKALNSEASPAQIALGLSFGMIAGFTPLFSLHNLIILFFVLILRINLSSYIVSTALFSMLAYALDPVFIQTGEALLTHPALQDTWTAMYNNDLWRIAHFNHTLMMGSLVISLAAFLPLLVASMVLIKQYRLHILAWVEKSKVMQILKASKFYRIYDRFAGNGDLS